MAVQKEMNAHFGTKATVHSDTHLIVANISKWQSESKIKWFYLYAFNIKQVVHTGTPIFT